MGSPPQTRRLRDIAAWTIPLHLLESLSDVSLRTIFFSPCNHQSEDLYPHSLLDSQVSRCGLYLFSLYSIVRRTCRHS